MEQNKSGRKEDLLEDVRNTLKRMHEIQRETKEQFQRTTGQIDRVQQALADRLKKIGRKRGGPDDLLIRYIYSILSPALPDLFEEKGFDVYEWGPDVDRVGSEGDVLSVDALAKAISPKGEASVIAVRVVRTVTEKEVDRWGTQLGQFFDYFTDLEDHSLHGCISGFHLHNDVHEYARKEGLYVVTNTGEGIQLV